MGPSLVPAVISSAAGFPLASGASVPCGGPAVSQCQLAAGLVGVGRTSVNATPIAASSLVSGISGGSGVADLRWQKVAGLVEDGWTIVKGKKMKPSIASFDMALRSQKKGSKGNV